MTETFAFGTVDTAAGTFGALLSDRGLCRLTYPTEPAELCAVWLRRRQPDARLVRGAGPARVAAELQAYLAGELQSFTVPLDLRGTPFQLMVWAALQAIPFGQVRSYTAVAAAIGRPRAVRAVGAANGANPVPIFVPCHRVMGSDGALRGYAGGLALKRLLLDLEGQGHRLAVDAGAPAAPG